MLPLEWDWPRGELIRSLLDYNDGDRRNSAFLSCAQRSSVDVATRSRESWYIYPRKCAQAGVTSEFKGRRAIERIRGAIRDSEWVYRLIEPRGWDGRAGWRKKGAQDEDGGRGWNGQGQGGLSAEERDRGNKRASCAAPLSKYFYDVAAFRGSLVKKGFPLCWPRYHCKMLPVRFYIAVYSAFATISRLFEATTLSDVREISMITRPAGCPADTTPSGSAKPEECPPIDRPRATLPNISRIPAFLSARKPDRCYRYRIIRAVEKSLERL